MAGLGIPLFTDEMVNPRLLGRWPALGTTPKAANGPGVRIKPSLTIRNCSTRVSAVEPF
jgi:hypothetical protein